MSAALAAPQPIAREYLRVSADASGRMVSIDRQHDENAGLAAEQGWLLGDPYAEPGAISASRYGSKAREGFASLIADLEAGRFGADLLLLWEASRGSRRAWEWARLIEALKDAGVSVHIASEGRTYDPQNWRDRKALRDSASDSETESDKISSRVGSAMRREAAAGNPHGRRVYGYERQYRIEDGTPLRPGEYRLASDKTKVARQVPHPVEGPAVRLIFASLLQGESLRSISAALAGEGPRPAMGKALAAAAARLQGKGAPGNWTPPRVRDVALNPAYAGKRLHKPEAQQTGHQPEFTMADLTDGNWEPLIGFAEFMDVAAKLRAQKPTARMPGRQPRHLLSMIASCGTCGGPVSVRYTHKRGQASYTCRDGGHVTTDRDQLDALIAAMVTARLARPDAYPAMAARDDDAALAAARDAEAAVRAEHAELAAMVAAGKLSAMLAASAEPGILARIEAAAARVAELQAPRGLSSLGLQPGDDIAARWDAAPLSARRAAVRELLDRISILPAGRGFAGPVTDRLEVAWRQ